MVIQSASIKQGNLAVSPDNTGKSIVASSDHSMKNSQKSEAVSSGQNTNSNIEGILTRLQLVANREEKDFVNYDKMVPQEKVDFAMVLELIRAFLLKESPCSVVYEKGTPFLKTSVFQEGLLNQYKIGMLRSIYNLLGDLTGLPTSKEKPQSGTEKNTYPNCFVLCWYEILKTHWLDFMKYTCTFKDLKYIPCLTKGNKYIFFNERERDVIENGLSSFD